MKKICEAQSVESGEESEQIMSVFSMYLPCPLFWLYQPFSDWSVEFGRWSLGFGVWSLEIGDLRLVF